MREPIGLLSWTWYNLLGYHVVMGKLNEKKSAWINKLITGSGELLQKVWRKYGKSSVSISVLFFRWSSAFNLGIPVCFFVLIASPYLFIHSFIRSAWESSACSLLTSWLPVLLCRGCGRRRGWGGSKRPPMNSLLCKSTTVMPCGICLPWLLCLQGLERHLLRVPSRLQLCFIEQYTSISFLSSTNLQYGFSCWFPSHARSLTVVGLFF